MKQHAKARLAELSPGAWAAAFAGSLLLHAALAAAMIPLLGRERAARTETEISFSAPPAENVPPAPALAGTIRAEAGPLEDALTTVPDALAALGAAESARSGGSDVSVPLPLQGADAPMPLAPAPLPPVASAGPAAAGLKASPVLLETPVAAAPGAASALAVVVPPDAPDGPAVAALPAQAAPDPLSALSAGKAAGIPVGERAGAAPPAGSLRTITDAWELRPSAGASGLARLDADQVPPAASAAAIQAGRLIAPSPALPGPAPQVARSERLAAGLAPSPVDAGTLPLVLPDALTSPPAEASAALLAAAGPAPSAAFPVQASERIAVAPLTVQPDALPPAQLPLEAAQGTPTASEPVSLLKASSPVSAPPGGEALATLSPTAAASGYAASTALTPSAATGAPSPPASRLAAAPAGGVMTPFTPVETPSLAGLGAAGSDGPAALVPATVATAVAPSPAVRGGAGLGGGALALRPLGAAAAETLAALPPSLDAGLTALGGDIILSPPIAAAQPAGEGGEGGGTGRGSGPWRKAVSFVRGFGGSRCFAALPVEAGDAIGLEAFGSDRNEMRDFAGKSNTALGSAEKVSLGNLAGIQCSALRLARSSKLYPDFTLGISMNRPDGASDDSVGGTVTGAERSAIHLFLIDEGGAVQTVDRFAPGDPDRSFTIPFDAGELGEAKGLLMAIASDKPLANLLFDSAMEAPVFFNLLQEEENETGAALDIALRAFDLGGGASAGSAESMRR